MGRLVRINPATEEKNSQAAVVATGAHGRLVRTGDVQRTSPAGNTVKLPSAQSVYQKALDEAMMKRAAADQKNKERGRKSYNRTHAQEVREITGDKTKKSITPIIKSAAAGYAADMVGAADTLLRAPSGLNYAASQERGEIEASKKNIAAYTEKLKAAKTEEERQQWQTLIDRNKRLIEINSKAAGERAKNYQDATRGAQEKLQGTYQKLRKIASDNMEKANEGLTPVGKYLNNVGVAGAQMAADAALGGGSALGPMFLRVFGGNSQEAAEAADKPGMSAAEQLDAQNRALLYGTASGAVSIATEKISNVAAPFKKAFGGGFLDKAIDGAIAKMNGNAAGRLALSFLSEGGEEVIEDIVQPALQTIYNGQSAGQNYSELDAAEILNDFLVGGALGLIGSGVEGIHNADARLAAERAAGEAAAPTAEQQNTMPAQPAAAQEGAQGMGEGNLAPMPQNAAQGVQEASTSVDTNQKNHTLEEKRRAESAFMSKEKGSTGTVLNMENISPQVTPEAPQRANASFDNTVPQESGGVKAQKGAESAQTAQEDNTTTAGGLNHGGQEVQNHAGGAEFAEAGERTDLSNGNGRRGTGSSAREQIGGVGGSGSQRTAEQSRTALERQNHARNLRLEPISSAELGVRAGTDTKSVTVLPESAWDARLQETAQRIRRETGKTPVFVLGSIPVRGSDRVLRVRGVWAGGQIIVQADHMNVSPEQIASHEIFHEYADQNPGLIQAVERSIREKFGDKEFDSIVESYIRNLRGIIDIDENAADYEVEQALLDVKNEILADAYADINAFGEKAGKYQENVRQTLEERGIVDTGRETAAATERRTGPPERFSYAGRDAGNADLEALHEAERYEMQGVDAETIRQKTGWFRGADGKWRWEIDDSGMKLRTDAADISNYTTLGELVDAPALFATYPDMKDMDVTFQTLERGQNGGYNRRFDSIELSRGLKNRPEALLNSLTHEVQHAIQQKEGFTPGANLKYWNRKLEEGYDGRDAETRREGTRLREQYEQMKANDPEFMRSMEELNAMAPTVPRGKVDMDTWEQVEPDPPEWVRFDERRDQLEEKYGDRVWDYFSLRDSIDRNARDSRLPGDLYRDTAGEIEARDAAARRGLTAEERRGRKPDTGDENTVFADGSGWSSHSEQDSETSSIKEQIENSREKLNAMGLVARASVPTDLKSKDAAAQWAAERLKSSGYKVDRQGYGDIYFSKKDMDKGLRYADTAEEKAALAVLPQVLKRGIEIGGHANHKGRTKQTITFAAPVELNGTRGNMAVVVNKNGNHYYAHRIVLPDGTAFRFSEEGKSNAAQELSRGVTVSGSLADTTSAASENSIPKDGKHVKYSAFNEEVARQLAGEEREKQRYSAESDEFYERLDEELADRALKEDWRRQRQQESTYAKAEHDAKREDAGNLKPVRKVTKPTEESKPTIAKRDLQKAILDTFSVPVEDRDALRTTIDRYADSVIKNGKLTEKERDAFFDKMYESGIIKTTADETMRSMGQYVARRKVYVPAEVKALFGQDWNGFRKRAYAAGVYLTNDKSAIGVDAFNAELSEQLPTIFNKTETDGRRVLERVVQLAEEGQAERMSLSDYIAEIAGKDSVRGEQLYRELERKMDNALQTFAEKADLEIKLRDRTGIKLAQQREQFDQRQQAQRAQWKEWESAEKAKKQAENKKRERAARERDLIREAKARERRTEAARRRRENRELREMQQKTLKQLQWLSKNRNRAPEAMKKAWDEALGDIDIYAARAADEMHWSKRYEATWGDLRDMYLEAKKGAENGDPKYANFLPSKELERIVDRLDKDKIADMDIDALKDLYKAAVGLRTEFYNRNKVLNDEADRLFQEVYTDATRELRSAPSGGKDKSKSGGLLDELINNQQLSPMNIIQRMGGWNPNGTFYSMAKQLESGERNVRDYTVKANRLLENFLNEHQDWVKKADGQGKDAIWYELEVPELIELGNGDKPIFGETVKVYMTPAQKVHLYLESKNYDNLLHMTGGRTFVDKELYSKGKRREALERGTTIKLAPESVQKIVSDLTPEEAELARILKGYYNDFAPKEINKVSNVLLGYDKAITKNYAPIYTNQNYTKSEFGVFDMTAEGVGNLKERKRSTTPSYNISAFDAFEKHVDQTARYTGMAIPTRNMSTLMSWRGEHDSMQDVLAHEWGGKANEYIKDLVIEMQGGKSEKSTVAEIIPEKVFSNYISSVFGFNPSIVLKQLGSIPMGSAYLGAKNFPSVKQIHHIDKALISKYTQELAWRTMGYSMPETKQLKDNPNWTETNRVVNTIFGGGAITAMDGWAASILWPQAENKVRREHPELKIGTAEQVENGESPFYQEVAREFNDAVARSQSTSDIIHQSTLRRSKNPVARAFTLFKSDSAQTYNAIRQKYGEWQYYKRSGASEETLKKAKRGIGEAVLAALVNAVWSGTVTFLVAAVRNGAKRYRDDDDELTIESVLKEFGMGLVGDLAGVMAGGEELADIIGNGITGEKWYRIEAPGLEQMDDLIEGINERLGSFFEHAGELHNIIQNKGDVGEFLHREGRDIAGWIREVAKDAATYLPGVPANNIEAYLLGTVRTLSPELAAAYEDAFMRVEKSDLKHQHGRTLTAKVRDLLKDRTGKDSKEAAGVIASLYDSGHTDAVPTATPSYVTIDKVKHELNAYQTQVYEKAWRKAISGELDEMVQLPVFRRASEEMREKMLDKLYSYASDMAKAAVFDDYEPRTSTQTMSENAKHGLTVAVQIVGEVGKENDPKGLSLPTP